MPTMTSASVCTQPLAGRPWAAPAGVSTRRAAASARPRPVRARAEATATGDSVASQSEDVNSVGQGLTLVHFSAQLEPCLTQ
jgi:hypothetical protein